jgi:two-component system sensor histidine kinase BaeS
MSFRLRVLLLISLVAVSAIGATAYLAFMQASRQVTESATADQRMSAWILGQLARYGAEHGTWEGVAWMARDLSASTGQRIKLVSEDGVVVADTDTIAGRTARPVIGPALFVDVRTSPDLPADATGHARAAQHTLRAISQYRSGVRFAACLTRNELGVVASSGAYGLPAYTASVTALRDRPDAVDECRAVLAATDGVAEDARQLAACAVVANPAVANRTSTTNPALSPCFETVFFVRTAEVAPVPLLVYLGAAGQPGPLPTPGPVMAAAALVALLTVAGTVLLSRRVLRPIAALTTASQRLGQGDLSLRVPVRGRDELAKLAGSFNRMADSLQRGEERQRRLVVDVAHELRTPLANIRGYVEALKDGVVPPTAEVFESLHEEAVLQQRIVDDLQELALAEAGALAYHRHPTDLTELLEICRIAHQAAADAVDVTLRVAADRPVTIDADPDRLRQVIGNLVSNALRATPPGGTVTLAATGVAEGRVTVEVRDTGVGIPADDLPHIFDRFWRADSARSRDTGGSGLGLAIARQIVRDHGGDITASSRPGQGTTVGIALPAPTA